MNGLSKHLGFFILGGVFAAAATVKVLSFDAFVQLLDVALHLKAVPGAARVVGACVVGLEVFLAVTHLLGTDRGWLRRITLVTLVVFSGFLLYQVVAPSGQGCGCLSAVARGANARHDAVLGLVRNAGLLLLVVWLGWQARSSGGRSPSSSESQGARGFTLVELLVVILLVGVLLSILLPALSGARKSAKDTRQLTLGRGLGAAVETYTIDYKGLYPNLGIEGQLLERPYVNGVQLPLNTSGYFKANSWFWPSVVVPTYFSDRASIETEWGEPVFDGMIPTQFRLAHCLMASSRYWTGDNPGADWSELRGQGPHLVVYPSRKGLLLRANIRQIVDVHDRDRMLSVVVGCDGAAAVRRLDEVNLPDLGENRVVGRETAQGGAILNTETGVAGIDY